MMTPVLETTRFILRPLTMQDARDVYDGWVSDERVIKFMIYTTHKSIEETTEWLKTDVEGNKKEGYYNWVIVDKSNSQLIGCIGIFEKKEFEAYELGYNIRFDRWNQGVTTEAAKKVLAFGKETLLIRKFIAGHALDNPASGKVMEKCGFQYAGEYSYSKLDNSAQYNGKRYQLYFDN